MVTFTLSALWSPSLTDVVVSVSFQVAVVEKKRRREMLTLRIQRHERAPVLFIYYLHDMCVCVRAGVAVHQEEDEHRACVHSDRYLRFKAIICKFCLLFIRFQ